MTPATTRLSTSNRVLAWSQLGDDLLARRAAAGSDAAFTALFERYHGPLLGYCRSIVLDVEDASDAAQSALESALRALPTRDTSRPLRPWLYRIAHNEAVDILRRRRCHDELGPDTAPLTALQPSPELYAEQRGRLEQLVEDLRSLPERQRGALVMRELSGLSYDEIAGALGLTPANARRAVFDARSALHDVADGRDAECTAIRHALSDGDRRSMRARRIRAHLRSCDECRSFQRAIGARQASLSLLAPWLSGATVAGVLGVGAGAGTGAGGGALIVGGGSFSLAALPAAAKSLALVAVVATTGTAAVEIHRAAAPERPVAHARAAVAPHAPADSDARRAKQAAAAVVAHAAERRASRVSAGSGPRRAQRLSAAGAQHVVFRPKHVAAAAGAAPSPGAESAAKPAPTAEPAPKPTPAPARPTPQPVRTPTVASVTQQIEQIQAQVQAALAQAQMAAAAGKTSALQDAGALVTTTISSAQATIRQLLGSLGIAVPASIAGAAAPPAGNPSAASVTTPVQQVLGGVDTLLSGLLGHR